jgi:hypothetical protein
MISATQLPAGDQEGEDSEYEPEMETLRPCDGDHLAQGPSLLSGLTTLRIQMIKAVVAKPPESPTNSSMVNSRPPSPEGVDTGGPVSTQVKPAEEVVPTEELPDLTGDKATDTAASTTESLDEGRVRPASPSAEGGVPSAEGGVSSAEGVLPSPEGGEQPSVQSPKVSGTKAATPEQESSAALEQKDDDSDLYNDDGRFYVGPQHETECHHLEDLKDRCVAMALKMEDAYSSFDDSGLASQVAYNKSHLEALNKLVGELRQAAEITQPAYWDRTGPGYRRVDNTFRSMHKKAGSIPASAKRLLLLQRIAEQEATAVNLQGDIENLVEDETERRDMRTYSNMFLNNPCPMLPYAFRRDYRRNADVDRFDCDLEGAEEGLRAHFPRKRVAEEDQSVGSTGPHRRQPPGNKGRKPSAFLTQDMLTDEDRPARMVTKRSSLQTDFFNPTTTSSVKPKPRVEESDDFESEDEEEEEQQDVAPTVAEAKRRLKESFERADAASRAVEKAAETAKKLLSEANKAKSQVQRAEAEEALRAEAEKARRAKAEEARRAEAEKAKRVEAEKRTAQRQQEAGRDAELRHKVRTPTVQVQTPSTVVAPTAAAAPGDAKTITVSLVKMDSAVLATMGYKLGEVVLSDGSKVMAAFPKVNVEQEPWDLTMLESETEDGLPVCSGSGMFLRAQLSKGRHVILAATQVARLNMARGRKPTPVPDVEEEEEEEEYGDEEYMMVDTGANLLTLKDATILETFSERPIDVRLEAANSQEMVVHKQGVVRTL